MAVLAILILPLTARAAEGLMVPNGDFQTVSGKDRPPDGWQASFGKGPRASIEVDTWNQENLQIDRGVGLPKRA
jgi:hypothetical protein